MRRLGYRIREIRPGVWVVERPLPLGFWISCFGGSGGEMGGDGAFYSLETAEAALSKLIRPQKLAKPQYYNEDGERISEGWEH